MENEAEALRRAIRARCLDCMGNCRAQVAQCSSEKCSLWPYRMPREEAARYHAAGDGEPGFQISMLEMAPA